MKAFATGGTGFTGSHVVSLLLKNGHSLRCLHRPKSDRSVPLRAQPEIEWVFGEISEAESLSACMQGTDILVNIASLGFGHAGHGQRAGPHRDGRGRPRPRKREQRRDLPLARQRTGQEKRCDIEAPDDQHEEDGTVTVRGRFTAEVGALLVKALKETRKVAVAKFTRTFGTLVSAGVRVGCLGTDESRDRVHAPRDGRSRSRAARASKRPLRRCPLPRQAGR